jgi:CRISPR-associated endoribonuclease Cas6
MRIHLQLSKNKETVPYHYQQNLAGAFHKWLGIENPQHDAVSTYSWSWLRKGKKTATGFTFPQGADWFISFYEEDVAKKAITGIMAEPEIAFGMSVKELVLQENPTFEEEQYFYVASPIFIKKPLEAKKEKYYYYSDEESNGLMTKTLRYKLNKANLNSEGVEVKFDQRYKYAKTKITKYKGIDIAGSVCPVIVKGTPEQISFAWNVGVGNSSGIGFGSLEAR